jgi:hypothetical protein
MEIWMPNTEREALWKERVAQWRASGQSQRAFALNQGYAQRQLNYWARRLAAVDAAPALLPLSIQRPASVAPAISLRSPSGWTVTLPPALLTSWMAELLRALA